MCYMLVYSTGRYHKIAGLQCRNVLCHGLCGSEVGRVLAEFHQVGVVCPVYGITRCLNPSLEFTQVWERCAFTYNYSTESLLLVSRSPQITIGQ